MVQVLDHFDSRTIAVALSEFFMTNGQYEDVAAASSGVQAISSGGIADNFQEELGGFAGLSVRAVGHSEYDTDTQTKAPTCYIYTSRVSKKQKKDLSEAISAVRTRIINVGKFSVKPELSAATTNLGHTARYNGNISCGTSIGLAGEASAGTLGAFLRDRDGKFFALSNNHVFGGCNHTPKGHPILSPSAMDAKAGGPGIEQFAMFHSLIELRSGHIGHVESQKIDVALAEVLNPSRVSSMQGNSYDTPAMNRLPVLGENVKKVGRTTGFTTGIVQSLIPTLLTLPYKSKHFSATVYYSDIYSIVTDSEDAFALPGDSGSLIVSEDSNAALGLLFAASTDGKIGFMASMESVLKTLPQLSLLSNHQT
jgi:hypothetical protein